MLVRNIKLGTIATTIAFTGLLTFGSATTYAQGAGPNNMEQDVSTEVVAAEANGRGRGTSWLTSEEKQALIAGVLGMSVEDLAAAKEAGQSMDEIVEAQGLTEEEFDTAKDAAMIAAANQAVADGELTQEEADAIIDRIENGGDRNNRSSWLTDEEKQALIADVLGMSVEDLAAAKEVGQNMDEIAEAQGLTEEEFDAAKDAAMIAATNQAVADGELTQEEADSIINRIENGGDRNSRSSWLTDEEKQALIADVLGMSVEDLAAAKEAGQSMDEIAEAQGLTEEEFDAAKDAAMITAVNQAVTDGELTQEEADAIIDRIENGGNGNGHRGHGDKDHGKSSWLTDEEKQVLIAGVLGMSVEDLAAAKEADQSLSEISEAQGMTIEAFRADLDAALIVTVNQAVTDGELTQEQADRIIQRIESDKGNRDSDDDASDADTDAGTDAETDGEVQALSILSFASSVTEAAGTTQIVQVFMPIVMR